MSMTFTNGVIPGFMRGIQCAADSQRQRIALMRAQGASGQLDPGDKPRDDKRGGFLAAP